ncbi:hypothetical protein HKD37_08G023377 [Glycine soja]
MQYIDAIKGGLEIGSGNQLILYIEDSELKELYLIEIEKLLNSNGRSLKDCTFLSCPDSSNFDFYENKFIVEQFNYDTNELTELYALLKLLTKEQLDFFFLYGYGGTRKTFLWNTLSAAIRAQKKIVLNVASSDISSFLLHGGRIDHSTFSIPLLMTEELTCNIAQGSLHAKLLIETKLIIWDKAPIMNRYCFKVLDHTLRDLMCCKCEENKYKPFMEKFMESLQSVEIDKKNKRLTTAKTNQIANEIKKFADWILQIGNGDMNSDDKGDIEIPTNLLVLDNDKPLPSLVDFVYSNILENLNVPNFFEVRAILTPTLEIVEAKLHDESKMIQSFSSTPYSLNNKSKSLKRYLSSYSPCHSDEDYQIQGDWFTPEFLNEIKYSGIPNHKLRLKVGVPVMLLRNSDKTNGLCNDTRLQVKHLGQNIITITVLTDKNYGDTNFIVKMDLVPSDHDFPFKFQHRQFPLSLCFAMTINKKSRTIII